VKVTVEKVDDINYIVSGTVDNKMIEDKVAQFKEEAAAKKEKGEASSNEKIEQAAAGQVFNEFVEAGIQEAKLDVESILGQPGLKKYEQRDNSVYFEVELSTSPQIDLEIGYMDVMPSFTKPKADPAAVEKKLAEFVQQQAPFKKIEKARAVKDGDVTIIDFKGYIDDEPFEGGSAEEFKLKIGSQSFIPGFEEQLIGMEYGEERTITVHFPKEYQSEDLAGKESKFVVKLHEIQEQQAETPDDAFAQKILSDNTATLATLKDKMADQVIAEELSQIYVNELKPKIIDGLLAKFDFTLPNNIIEQEIDAMVRVKTSRFSEDEHKQYMEDKAKFQELRESLREEARETIKAALITEAIANKEGVNVDEQEVISALSYQAMMAGQDAHELVKYYQENNLMKSAQMGLTQDKLFGQLLGFDK